MATKPNIAFLCSGLSWGGLEMNVLRLAGWLTERKIKVHLIAHPDSPLTRQANRVALPCHSYSAVGKKKILSAASTIASLSKEHDLKIIVVHNRSDLPAAVLAKVMFGGKFKLVYQQHMQLGGDKRDLLHTWLYKHIDSWIAPLHLHAASVRKRTRINPNKVTVIPFGVNLNDLKGGLPNKTEARKALTLPEDETIIGVVGRIDPKKGQDSLIEAVRLLHQQNRHVHALIVGARTVGEATAFEKQLHQSVDKYGLSDFVHFRPFLDKVGIAFTAMDIFALTSHSETYGLVTLEAMACGVPVIGTDSGGTPELIDHEQTGLLVPPRDHQALADAIIGILDQNSLRETISTSAASKVETDYSHTTQVDRFVSLFDAILR